MARLSRPSYIEIEMNPVRSVGIFWVYRRKIIAFSDPVDAVTEIRGVKDSNFAHADIWINVVKQHNELAGKEYWAIPRGRVIFRTRESAFVIYASSSVISDKRLLMKIERHFNLMPKSCRWFRDRHYDPPGDDLFDE